MSLLSLFPCRRQKFNQTVLRLVGVALACGVFSGARGGIFTVSMTRLNVRLRSALFKSLLSQDVAFYDSEKIGSLTSRLSADTSSVSDSVSLNLNIMVRSATQAAIVLSFMFAASWRLTVVTFTIIPLVGAVSKVYGGARLYLQYCWMKPCKPFAVRCAGIE